MGRGRVSPTWAWSCLQTTAWSLPGATLAPGQAPSRPAGVAPEGLGWEPATLWGAGAGKDSRDPCPPPTSLHGPVREPRPPCGSEASVGPMAPAHKGSPSWGPEASCPSPASTSGLTSHVLSLTLGAWGVGQTSPLSVKPSEHHRARLWGHPSGSNPQRHPSRGYSVTQLHRLYRGDSDSSTPRVTVQVSERGLQSA